jgi:hypothetical protein
VIDHSTISGGINVFYQVQAQEAKMKGNLMDLRFCGDTIPKNSAIEHFYN